MQADRIRNQGIVQSEAGGGSFHSVPLAEGKDCSCPVPGIPSAVAAIAGRAVAVVGSTIAIGNFASGPSVRNGLESLAGNGPGFAGRGVVIVEEVGGEEEVIPVLIHGHLRNAGSCVVAEGGV